VFQVYYCFYCQNFGKYYINTQAIYANVVQYSITWKIHIVIRSVSVAFTHMYQYMCIFLQYFIFLSHSCQLLLTTELKSNDGFALKTSSFLYQKVEKPYVFVFLKIQEHTQFQKLPLTGICVTDTPQVFGSGKLLFMWFSGLWWHIFIFNFTNKM